MLQGETELTEKNIDQALKDVRLSLLEADVEFKVTKTFLGRVKEKALGETVKLRARAAGKKTKVSPGAHFVKICQDELINLMGPVDTNIAFAKTTVEGTLCSHRRTAAAGERNTGKNTRSEYDNQSSSPKWYT